MATDSNSVPDGGDARHGQAGALGRQPEHARDADVLSSHVAGEEEGEGGHSAAHARKEHGPRVEGGGKVILDVGPEEEKEGER